MAAAHGARLTNQAACTAGAGDKVVAGSHQVVGALGEADGAVATALGICGSVLSRSSLCIFGSRRADVLWWLFERRLYRRSKITLLLGFVLRPLTPREWYRRLHCGDDRCVNLSRATHLDVLQRGPELIAIDGLATPVQLEVVALAILINADATRIVTLRVVQSPNASVRHRRERDGEAKASAVAKTSAVVKASSWGSGSSAFQRLVFCLSARLSLDSHVAAVQRDAHRSVCGTWPRLYGLTGDSPPSSRRPSCIPAPLHTTRWVQAPYAQPTPRL